MINRELIRIKAVQLTYAYFQNGNHNIDNAEKELMFSLTKAYHLYETLLLLIVAVTRMARKHYDIASAKAEREGSVGPIGRFAFNKFAVQLEENKQLREFAETQKNIWEDKAEFVKNLYLQMEQSEPYQEYITSDDDEYETHREVWRKLYKLFIQNNDDLCNTLEEDSIYWNDDKEVVDTFVLKTIKRFDPANGADQELLPEYTDEEDRVFAQQLFHAAIVNADQYQQYMTEASRNWDFSRLAYMDVVIMQLAIAEMLTFPNIPVNVTINEYVGLAKLYSTSRSGGYINGMLDAIARHLIDNGTLLKVMPEKPEKKEAKPKKTTKNKK
ncbi:MAG: transcription antitermination factor NusB [Prevotella sp.]|nr:transcription antitermination factor NusB [Prevotella sp.]MBR1839857.1 transcription antitermination factor NusB [Prevotella sp.]